MLLEACKIITILDKLPVREMIEISPVQAGGQTVVWPPLLECHLTPYLHPPPLLISPTPLSPHHGKCPKECNFYIFQLVLTH